jgi:hypothetical protein
VSSHASRTTHDDLLSLLCLLDFSVSSCPIRVLSAHSDASDSDGEPLCYACFRLCQRSSTLPCTLLRLLGSGGYIPDVGFFALRRAVWDALGRSRAGAIHLDHNSDTGPANPDRDWARVSMHATPLFTDFPSISESGDKTDVGRIRSLPDCYSQLSITRMISFVCGHTD